jgi:hypothetical protein
MAKSEDTKESESSKEIRRTERRLRKELKRKEKLSKSTDKTEEKSIEQTKEKKEKKGKKEKKKTEEKNPKAMETKEHTEETTAPVMRNGPAAKKATWNDWSQAKFDGDDSKKDKFLRLMGGKNLQFTKSTSGSDSISNEKIVLSGLEQQFEQARALQDKKRKGQRLALGRN